MGVLFPSMGNGAFGETPEVLLRRAVQRLRALLPSSWQVDLLPGPVDERPDAGYDADIVVWSPGGKTYFVAQARSAVQGVRSAQDLVRQMRRVARDFREPLVVTNYANPALRQVLEDAGVSYLDETGWVHLRSDDTGLFVSHGGASKAPAPDRRDSSMGRLDGPGASAVIRSLWDLRKPTGVRELAGRAQVSPGTVAKVLPSLARYGAVERDETGAVGVVDRRLLLERWVQDYGIYTTNSRPQWFLAPRGVPAAYSQLWKRYDSSRDRSDSQVQLLALTGYAAAVQALPKGVHPVIPDTLLSLYSTDPEVMASSLMLKPATRQTANVVIVEPRDVSLLRQDPLSVPICQALADLMTMGGRFPELAEQVLDVLEDEWTGGVPQ